MRLKSLRSSQKRSTTYLPPNIIHLASWMTKFPDNMIMVVLVVVVACAFPPNEWVPHQVRRLSQFSPPMDDGFDVRAPTPRRPYLFASRVHHKGCDGGGERSRRVGAGHKHLGDHPRKRLPSLQTITPGTWPYSVACLHHSNSFSLNQSRVCTLTSRSAYYHYTKRSHQQSTMRTKRVSMAERLVGLTI